LGFVEDELGCPLQVSLHQKKYVANCKLAETVPSPVILEDIVYNHQSKLKIRNFFHLSSAELNSSMKAQHENKIEMTAKVKNVQIGPAESTYLSERNHLSAVEQFLAFSRGVSPPL